mmetsp:Transcript_77311/g.216091  ORF Transcript_77311/g.216091 Transcript_77311/m.216091 type:complete len:218 (-) Transcript_77311:2224-2877(-)
MGLPKNGKGGTSRSFSLSSSDRTALTVRSALTAAAETDGFSSGGGTGFGSTGVAGFGSSWVAFFLLPLAFGSAGTSSAGGSSSATGSGGPWKVKVTPSCVKFCPFSESSTETCTPSRPPVGSGAGAAASCGSTLPAPSAASARSRTSAARSGIVNDTSPVVRSRLAGSCLRFQPSSGGKSSCTQWMSDCTRPVHRTFTSVCSSSDPVLGSKAVTLRS